MLVYNYNIQGWYIGSKEANNDPVENPNSESDGRWLLPANATFTAPPTAGSGQLQRMVSGSWVLQTDPAITAAQFVVFYRNQSGLDTKVLSGAPYPQVADDSGVISYNGKPMSDSSNANVAALVIPSQPTVYSAINDNGVQTLCVVSGAIASRASARVNADPANAGALRATCASAIAAAYLSETGVVYDPGTAALAMNQLMYIAQNIGGGQTTGAISAAQASLAEYNAAFTQAQTLTATCTAAIAALDSA